MSRQAAIEAIARAINHRQEAKPQNPDRATDRMRALYAIEPGSFADFAVKDAFEAASLRGSVYRTLGRGQARCKQMSRKVVRVFRMETV